jgi:hypothetical protein
MSRQISRYPAEHNKNTPQGEAACWQARSSEDLLEMVSDFEVVQDF